ATLLLLGVAACARFQPTQPAVSASSYTPTGFQQSFTLKNESIHYDPSVLQVGASRSAVEAVYGQANDTRTSEDGTTEEIYAFNPDGSKFVNPQVRARNIALGFFTAGASVAVRQARLALTERKLTLFHVIYTPDGTIKSVTEERLSGAPESLPTASSTQNENPQ
ncbi:MAG TPA: hypothetical protein VJN94_15875, partial [Candidatus Binataceae bacterium]|nr:hypothetical protein [Candidatus Binataceae bacterium]